MRHRPSLFATLVISLESAVFVAACVGDAPEVNIALANDSGPPDTNAAATDGDDGRHADAHEDEGPLDGGQDAPSDAGEAGDGSGGAPEDVDAGDVPSDAGDDANDSGGGSVDGGADAATDSGHDAGDASVAECDIGKPFGPALAVPGLPGDALGLRLFDDERLVYYARSGLLYSASRATRGDDFANITPVPMPAPDAGVDTFPTLDGSLLSIYFGSSRGGSFAIWGSTRAGVAFDFAFPMPVANINAQIAGRPSITADGEELFFQVYTGAEYDVVVAQRSAGGFAPPTDVLVGPTFDDAAPAITADGLTLYFASVRNAEPAHKGGYDVWVMRRASRTSAWSAPKIESEASTSGVDLPTWGSNDGCRLYVSSQTTSHLFVRPL